MSPPHHPVHRARHPLIRIVSRLTSPPLVVAWLVALSGLSLAAQSADIGPERGLRRVDPRWHALVGADVVTEPGARVQNATIVLRDGVIMSVEADGAAPDGARVWDLSGLTVYAGLVDPFVPVDAPKPGDDDPNAAWSPMLTPQRSALDGPGLDTSGRKALRDLGFGAVSLAPSSGIVRGTSAVVLTGEGAAETQAEASPVLSEGGFQVLGFDRAPFSWDRQRGSAQAGYPMSEMGAVATLRQALSDADWYARAWAVHAAAGAGREAPVVDDALAAFAAVGPPLLFEADDELQALRAARLADEFGRELVLVGRGTEYRRLAAVAALGRPVIVPLSYPDKPKVGTRAEAEGVSLRSLMEWEQAPTNPRRLQAAGVEVALTSSRVEKRGDFYPNLHKAVQHGLAADDALAMLTTAPARMLGLESRLGKVAKGMLANLVVVDGELITAKPEIRDVWVGGRRYVVKPADAPERKGTWVATFASLGEHGQVTAELKIEGSKKAAFDLLGATLKARAMSIEVDRLALLLDGDDAGLPGVWQLSGTFTEADALAGLVAAPDGAVSAWSATRSAAAPEEAEDADEASAEDGGDDDGEAAADDGDEDDTDEADEDDDDAESDDDAAADVPETYGLPFGAFGFLERPAQETVLVRGATLWTSGPDGILEEADLLVRDGKISHVGPGGPGLEGRADRVIDGKGLHVTPGLIDCHSHTGVSGSVNEAGQRVTAEVSIADVIDPDDILWYRQLAGGLTGANQLHGSANAIGGQNSVVKLRWGVEHPDEMRLEGARPGIKFALGENPKRVSQNTGIPDEYPQTRMGVATLIRDRLTAARDDRAARLAYERLPDGQKRRTPPPRLDHELEVLGEVVAGERLIHCHSYRQDEILMLCLLAEEFGFTIGTFQHVLEGYKVAEAIAPVALGASTFADWWAYKYEVVDAIPHNAALMTQVGVVTSINSDSGDHARRLNTEAAKAVKYGGLSPAEALKLVTLNPAIQLAIDDRVGSLEPGKDADFVIWSGDPLSYASKPLSTWVDGRELFSLERDAALQAAADAERARLLQKLLADKSKAKTEDDEGDRDGDAPERGRRGRRGTDEPDPDDGLRGGPEPPDDDVARPCECGCYEGVGR